MIPMTVNNEFFVELLSNVMLLYYKLMLHFILKVECQTKWIVSICYLSYCMSWVVSNLTARYVNVFWHSTPKLKFNCSFVMFPVAWFLLMHICCYCVLSKYLGKLHFNALTILVLKASYEWQSPESLNRNEKIKNNDALLSKIITYKFNPFFNQSSVGGLINVAIVRCSGWQMHTDQVVTNRWVCCDA